MTVYDVAGSVLYDVTPDQVEQPRPLATLAAGDNQLKVPLLVDVDRCTGHALGEAKKPFVFPVWMSVSGSKYFYSTIPITPADEKVLRDLTDRRCKQGEPTSPPSAVPQPAVPPR